MLLNKIEIMYEQALLNNVDFSNNNEYDIAREIIDVIENNQRPQVNLKVIKNAE